MFLSFSSPVHSLRVVRPQHFLSRFAVPISLIVVNTFMMSASAEGALHYLIFLHEKYLCDNCDDQYSWFLQALPRWSLTRSILALQCNG